MKVITFLLSFLFSFILIGINPTAAEETQSIDQVNLEILEDEVINEQDDTLSPTYYDNGEISENTEGNQTESTEEITHIEDEEVNVGDSVSTIPENADITLEKASEEVHIQRQTISLMSTNADISKSLKNGDSGPEVLQLKRNLAKLGFVVSNNPNEDFGPKTTQVVKVFQGYYGLSVTGEGDEATLAKIDAILSSPYRVGQSSPVVKELKQNLAKLGFVVSNNPNIDYGPKTATVVSNFQRAYGLRINGIADEVTLKKITELLNGPLKQGMSSPRVVELKKDLATIGFVVSNNPNADFGPKTTTVVKEFQSYYGLPVTGIADEATLGKIEQILSSPYRVGKSSPAVKELKLNLEKLGFKVSDNPNEDYGPKTSSVVKDFQRKNGLRANGIVDDKTLATINSLLESLDGPLKQGMSSPRVVALKKDLATIGFVVSNNPNADFGPKTTTIVKEFQSYYGLPVTGIADEATFEKIEQILSSPYHVGKSSPAVKDLKLKLAKLGFVVSSNPNIDYGPKTKQVVQEFQSYYGLKANGIADEVTLKKIDAILSSPYSLGQSSPEIKILKDNLAELGFVVSDNPTNYYDEKTEKVVKEFQDYYGLRTSGIADEITLKKIADILSSPYRIGQSSPEVKELKIKLGKLGFVVSNNPNVDYGPKTANVVKDFQRAHGLRVNGIADEVTLRKIDEELKNKVITIFIDPGHGGGDPGAVAGGNREKDINLAVSKKVRNLLENRGYRVIMSRTDDSTVDLYDRPRMANELNVDIFVSIHSNSSENTSVHGIETYYYIYKSQHPPRINTDKHNDPVRIENSRKLAELVHSNLINYTGAKDRKVGRGAFVVTRETKMPAILIELGFISNPGERDNLTSNSYQDKLAKAITDGIVEYFKQK